MKKIIITLLICFLCLGCSDNENDGLINYIKAQELIINENAILLDVRTQEEYDENHIRGAILLPLDTIDEKTAANSIESKDTSIIVYCKSGNRSNEAKQKLEDLGYTNVYDLGSITNWEG